MSDESSFNYESSDTVVDSKLSGKYRHAWVEESLSEYSKNGKELAVITTRNFLGISLSSKKILWLSFFMIILTCIIFAKIFYLQIIQGNYYQDLSENNRIRVKPIPAERGLMYDRFNNQIVVNVPSFSLSVIPQDLPKNDKDRDLVISQISKVSGISKQDIINLIKKYSFYSFESLIVKDNLDYEAALSLYIQNSNTSGIVIEKGTKRLYKSNIETSDKESISLSHLVGYLGKINEQELDKLKSVGYLKSDYIGKNGLEKYYEQYLRGTYGRKKIEVDALGKEQSVLAEEIPVPGHHLILGLDLEAQIKMEELLVEMLDKNNFKKAIGIAMNPETGEILAMVSLPSFDNNDFSGGITEKIYNEYINNENNPLFNRAIAGTYPSGSTVKPLVAVAALEEKIITSRTSFLSTGGLHIDRWHFKDWKASGHGNTNVAKAIAWSVNTFFYYIGGGYGDFVGLGVDKISEYFKKFRLGSVTGIDLYGEKSGFIPSKSWKEDIKNEHWYVGDTYNLSIGQGDLLVTPLQVAVWTATIANGGKVVQPRLIKSIYNPVTKETKDVKTIYLNKDFVSIKNINIAKNGMRECVRIGSCKLLQTLHFTAGGKTGTAQWSNNHADHAWFTAFAPFNNPKIVVTVLVEEGESGSFSAMPVTKEFLNWWGKKYLK